MNCEHNVNLIPSADEISVLPEGVCPVDWAKSCIELARSENCGKSVMCRDGMTQLQAIITDLTRGRGTGEDLDLLRDLATVIANSKGCELAAKCAKNLLFSMDRYADDWDAHCRRKRCAALVCPSYYNIYVDPALCKGCGACINAAPEGAIAGGEGLISVVKDDSALKSAEFLAVCPNGALKKYGAIKPRIPEEPVAVGSFAAEGGGRRRRRG